MYWKKHYLTNIDCKNKQSRFFSETRYIYLWVTPASAPERCPARTSMAERCNLHCEVRLLSLCRLLSVCDHAVLTERQHIASTSNVIRFNKKFERFLDWGLILGQSGWFQALQLRISERGQDRTWFASKLCIDFRYVLKSITLNDL